MSYIGNEPISVAFLTDTFSGNGSTTAFTMTVAPANTSSIIVAITGVLQDPSTYSVSGTTLTFSAAPPTGTNNISVRYLGIPASGVTTTAYRTVTEFTATASQTNFSVPSYTVGYIDVYRNGTRLGAADYTATTGTTVVLASGATAGDLITTESFYVSSVLNAIPATAGAVNSTYLASSLTLTSPTLSSPVTSGTPTGVGVLTSGTAVASTSGTSIDFTSIPAWVKRITVMFSAVSTNGTSDVIVRLGTGGSPETSGYVGSVARDAAGAGNLSSGILLSETTSATAATVFQGNLVILNLTSNTWTFNGDVGRSNTAALYTVAGYKSLAGVLNLVRVTTVNGTDTFDAGSINILYE